MSSFLFGSSISLIRIGPFAKTPSRISRRLGIHSSNIASSASTDRAICRQSIHERIRATTFQGIRFSPPFSLKTAEFRAQETAAKTSKKAHQMGRFRTEMVRTIYATSGGFFESYTRFFDTTFYLVIAPR